MYKLLVVDDEQIVVDSIKYIVENNFSDIIVAGTARSGREAIEKAEIVKPDIVFMDIKMPGINGIDAIREIKSRFGNVLFVILTAYEYFEFAKEAVNLGVTEYLLKPVNRSKIVETIKKTIEIIDAEREKRRRELELREKLENILPVLENGFIYSILFFDDSSRELEAYKDILEIGDKGGYIMTVEFGEEEGPGTLGNRIGLSVKSQSFYPYFRDVIKSRCKCLVGPVMLNRIVVFVYSDFKDDEYSERLEALNIAEYVYNKLSEKVDADFYIGIGRRRRKIEMLYKSYEESLKAIRHAGAKGVMHIMDIPEESGVNPEYPVSKEKFMIERASAGDTAASLQAFDYIFEWLTREFENNLHRVKSKLLELMVLLHRMASDYEIYSSEVPKYCDYITDMMEIQDISTLKSWCRAQIEHITRSISSGKKKKVSSLILKAREYIDKNFSNEITLEDVAKEVNISPHYFSRLYKEETGENFIEYLTSVRINKAKELIETGGYSIKEICYMTGYGDPNYFSRIFKKVMGVTPSEYKEAMQNRK